MSWDNLYSSIKNKDTVNSSSFFQSLIENHDIPAEHKLSTLRLSCEYGDNKVLKQLLEAATFSDEENEELGKALHSAVKADSPKCVELLLSRGADVNFVSDDGDTALHLATKQNYGDNFYLLMNSKTDIKASFTVKDKDGDCVLHIAAKVGNAEFIKVLLEHGANPNEFNLAHELPLTLAIDHAIQGDSRKDCVEALMEKGASCLNLGRKNYTALMAAINRDNDKAVNVMLNYGTDINIQWPDETTDTILQRCVRENRLKCLLLLLSRGADTKKRNTENDTVLHILAKSRDHKLQAQSLLDHGADKTLRNYNNQCAFDIATKNKYWKIARLLKIDDDHDVLPKSEISQNSDVNVNYEKPKEDSEKEMYSNDADLNGAKEQQHEQNQLGTDSSEEEDDIEEIIPVKFTAPSKVPQLDLSIKSIKQNKHNKRKLKLTPSGGVLHHEDHNTEIVAPPGAITKKNGCNIQIKQFQFNSKEKGANFKAASDVLELQPHGQVFLEDIVLKFPLKLDSLYDANSLNLLYSDDVTGANPQWRPIAQESKDDEANYVVWSGSCYTRRSHFCGIFVKQEERSNNTIIPLTALLFVDHDKDSGVVKIRVVCTGSDVKSKEIAEKKYGCRSVDDQPVLLYKRGKHLQFNLKYDTEVWTTQTNQEFLDKDIFCRSDFTDLNNFSSIPHITFYLESVRDNTQAIPRSSEISVVISQKLSHKLGRDVHKSYFALKWQIPRESKRDMQDVQKAEHEMDNTRSTVSSIKDSSYYSDQLLNNMLHYPQNFPLMTLNIVGTGLGSGISPQEKPGSTQPLILDKDFRHFLKPVLYELDKHERLLREIAASVGMVVCESEKQLSAQFFLDVWSMRQSTLYESNSLQVWIELLKLLCLHDLLKEAASYLKLAIEKQKLKMNVGHFMKYFKQCETVCYNLVARDLLFEDQYLDVKHCRSEYERIEFFVVKVMLKSSKETFQAFKEELIKSKQKELFKYFECAI